MSLPNSYVTPRHLTSSTELQSRLHSCSDHDVQRIKQNIERHLQVHVSVLIAAEPIDVPAVPQVRSDVFPLNSRPENVHS